MLSEHFDIVGSKPMKSVDVFFLRGDRKHDHDIIRILRTNGIETYLSEGSIRRSLRRSFRRSVISIDDLELKAMAVSKFAVVFSSVTKPRSAGFLEELIAILEFQEKGSVTVIPIFLAPFSFDVEEKACKEYPERVPAWKAALTKLANIAAEYPFSHNFSGMSESSQNDRLEQIAHDICLLVIGSASNNLNALVAMDRHMKVVNDLLALEHNKEVHTIGISGSAGVGKTTLARYVYEKISVNFQTHVFLENVENVKDKILTSEGEEDPTVITSLDHDVHEITEARGKHRKVLLIADDVDNVEQAKWMTEYADWFAPGSRVILISHNKNLLVDAGVTDVYEVRTLRYDEALQLFSHFAFKQPYPPSDYELFAVRAVHLAGFLPVALRALGSFLDGKIRWEWIDTLLKLNAKQGGNIMEVWKLMEPSGDKSQEQWKAAAVIMEGKASSSQDEGKEREDAADIMEGSSQNKT